jgi:hypothetical protein
MVLVRLSFLYNSAVSWTLFFLLAVVTKVRDVLRLDVKHQPAAQQQQQPPSAPVKRWDSYLPAEMAAYVEEDRVGDEQDSELLWRFQPCAAQGLPPLTWQTLVCQDGKVYKLSSVKDIW